MKIRGRALASHGGEYSVASKIVESFSQNAFLVCPKLERFVVPGGRGVHKHNLKWPPGPCFSVNVQVHSLQLLAVRAKSWARLRDPVLCCGASLGPPGCSYSDGLLWQRYGPLPAGSFSAGRRPVSPGARPSIPFGNGFISLKRQVLTYPSLLALRAS